MSTRKTKILFFFHTNELGGAEKSALNIIQECIAKGFSVDAVVPNVGSLKDELEKVASKVSVVNYRWWCSSRKGISWYWCWEMVFSIFNLLSFWISNWSYKPDVVVTNTLTIPWGMLFSRLVGKPHIQLIREFGTLDFGFHFILGYERSLWLINKSSKYVFTNSRTMRDYYKTYIDDNKLDYIYPTIFSAKLNRSDKNAVHFTSKKSFKVLVLGTIVEAKGQLQAVKAVSLLFKKGYEDMELVLAGKKQSEEYFSQILEERNKNKELIDNIHLIDHLENPFSLLREADVVLICSKNEAFGRVAAEAMLFGKAIIATRSGANLELFDDEVSALLYSPGNANQLAEKIERLYKDRTLLETLGENAFARYTNNVRSKMGSEPLLIVVQKIVGK